jgi:hypothetical protein
LSICLHGCEGGGTPRQTQCHANCINLYNSCSPHLNLRKNPVKGQPIYSKPIVKPTPIQKSPGTNSSGSGNVILERGPGRH